MSWLKFHATYYSGYIVLKPKCFAPSPYYRSNKSCTIWSISIHFTILQWMVPLPISSREAHMSAMLVLLHTCTLSSPRHFGLCSVKVYTRFDTLMLINSHLYWIFPVFEATVTELQSDGRTLHRPMLCLCSKKGLPQKWRGSLVISIFKIGDKFNCNNFQEIPRITFYSTFSSHR
jgi:hypothetical protein